MKVTTQTETSQKDCILFKNNTYHNFLIYISKKGGS